MELLETKNFHATALSNFLFQYYFSDSAPKHHYNTSKPYQSRPSSHTIFPSIYTNGFHADFPNTKSQNESKLHDLFQVQSIAFQAKISEVDFFYLI